MNAKVHATALVEPDVEIGEGTTVWDGVHLRQGARIGRNCILGEKTYVASTARIGNLCKLNACVYVCAGVTIEDGVLVAAHTVFTNDRTPRATDPALEELQTSLPTAATLKTTVRRGASIGANCTIGPGLELGEFCMVGMGSVVTADVPAHGLVFGNPARLRGIVCRCGTVVLELDGRTPSSGEQVCGLCGRTVRWAATR